MAVLQPLIDLVALCAQQGIQHAVISPGSRSAALTLAFARSTHIKTYVIMDERAAGFIALGIAQQIKAPVAIVCTSGSAAYNFAPAVVEAYFQQVPLLVLTADRPKEWIHQQDGQTIYQNEIYGKHVKKAYELPADYTHPDAQWYINRTVNEAILASMAFPQGPVHINVPIREPFYPEASEAFVPTAGLRKVSRLTTEAVLSVDTWHELLNEWDESERILIAGGQHGADKDLNQVLSHIAEELHVPILGDVITNLQGNDWLISKQDLFLGQRTDEDLAPDLLITFGKSFISKNLKLFLRANPPLRHWHISEEQNLIDTFQTLTTQVPVSPGYFFAKLFEDIDYQRFVQNLDGETDDTYAEKWLWMNRTATRLLMEYLRLQTELNELTVYEKVLEALPDGSQLHVANSMPIRYVNMLGVGQRNTEVFTNRGTSGIDGCVSTAVGAALVNEVPTYLIVGDVAFLYDRNGLLLEEFPANLKIIVMNNSGGNIFRMIDGPARQPELEQYFETRHAMKAERTAADSGILYASVTETQELAGAIQKLVESKQCSLLEIFTDPETNTRIFKGLKEYIRSNW
ncbi:2-succinyl-5-enolpyruvyl-6-hydroxy-3-cyclohexene-1-carboxylic-acid synthase [Telluribacter humicola]|uniref:2-succinyl-5-enolpyruvyl-6-hydroxy-3- cyclohexene-1-carboxylic-acid synthase n=1 Tax=Telluribacter humicola TaxID=1720261 RepID=UPI001A979258|nr:2-succinyl-5-enolpyruvyl-6-hydroxy-3-cyclohexene-1-carboxylic-acid synthase [Telluribacter humicola]